MWTINEQPFSEDMIRDHTGFVYMITCITTNRKYIGQKNFYSTRSRIVKGKKKKIKSLSDYPTYYGSNTELNQHVLEQGEANFKREILHLCKNKGTQNYLELREQIDRRVMETNEYYNSFVGGKIHKKHIKLV